MRRMAVLLLLLITAQPSWAEWRLFAHSKDGQVNYYINPSTFSRSGNLVSAQYKLEMLAKNKFTILQRTDDCSSGNFYLKNGASYDMSGKLLKKDDPTATIKRTPGPSSVNKSVQNSACSYTQK